MKRILIILLLAAGLFSCKDKSVEPEAVDPYADSANIKLQYIFYYGLDVVYPNTQLGNIIILNFDGKIKNYDMYSKDRFGKVLEYKLTSELKKDMSFLDTLNDIFTNYKFSSYPNEIPFDSDSNEIPTFPCGSSSISFRNLKNESLKLVDILSCFRTGKYPQNFDEFYSKLNKLFLN